MNDMTSVGLKQSRQNKTLAPMGIAEAEMMAYGNTIEPRFYIPPDNNAAGKLAGD